VRSNKIIIKPRIFYNVLCKSIVRSLKKVDLHRENSSCLHLHRRSPYKKRSEMIILFSSSSSSMSTPFPYQPQQPPPPTSFTVAPHLQSHHYNTSYVQQIITSPPPSKHKKLYSRSHNVKYKLIHSWILKFEIYYISVYTIQNVNLHFEFQILNLECKFCIPNHSEL